MGVDYSATVGIGLVVPHKEWREFQKRVDPEGDLWGEELLHRITADTEGIGYAEAGNYWGHGATHHIITIDRLTKSVEYDDRNRLTRLPSFNGMTVSEWDRLHAIREELGLAREQVQPFLATLVS